MCPLGYYGHLVLLAFETALWQVLDVPNATQQLPRAIWATDGHSHLVLPAFETALWQALNVPKAEQQLS